MRKIETLQEIQDMEYAIMCRLVDFLEVHQIRYILAGGTMLGAVRHGGFIPWDDDIDLLVPRDDYEKLKRIKGEFRQKDLEIQCPGMAGYMHPFIKVVDKRTIVKDRKLAENYTTHVWIDVFPLDHFPDDPGLHKLALLRNKYLRAVLYTALKRNGPSHGGKLVRGILKGMYHLMGGYQNVCLKIDREAQRMDSRNRRSNHVGNGAWPESERDYFELSMIEPAVSHRFRDRLFNIPANYDGYLSQLYGNYMLPPPEGERARHDFEAYWADV